jgi:K+ transporter
LIYADGMLTPAISVFSAVEGLSVSAPMLAHGSVPLAVAILATLFAIQRFGTGKVGVLFGPIVLLWFATIKLLGLKQIIIHRVTLQFGFADSPDVPLALKQLLPESLRFHPGKATYFLGRESYGIGRNAGLFNRMRLFLFAAMARNASPATAYFQLPPGRVVELGAHITL